MSALTETKNPLVCPITGSSGVSFCYEKNTCGIYKNIDTGLHFVWPQPSTAEIQAIYSSSYFDKGSKYAPSTASAASPQLLNDQKRLAEVRKHFDAGKLLDVGCAKGDFLGVAKEAGFSVAGVEVSEFAALEAQKEYGVPVEIGTLEDTRFPSASFDVITLWDVIEHLPDPVTTIRAAYDLLKPGGVLLVSTGDISSLYARTMSKNWHLMTPPEHLFFFTPESISKLFKEVGFSAPGFSYIGKNACVDFALFKLSQSVGPAGRMLRRLASKLGMSSARLYVNLFDIMTASAKKPV